MKLSKKRGTRFFLLPLATTGIVIAAGNTNAALAPGQSIGLDFGTNNYAAIAAPQGWNAVSNTDGIANLIEINSTAGSDILTGVSLAYDVPVNFFNDQSGQVGSNLSPKEKVGPVPSPFSDKVAEDWSGSVDGGNNTANSEYTFTLAGLTDSTVTAYKVSIFVGAWTATDVIDNADVTINGQTQNYGDIGLNGVLLTFLDVVAIDGEINVSINGANNGEPNEVNVISGLHIAANHDPADLDGDGLADLWEDAHFGNNNGVVEASELALQTGADDGYPAADRDGATNEQEEAFGSDPNVADTDGDNVNDGDEIDIFGTDPIKADNGDDDNKKVTGQNQNGLSTNFGETDPFLVELAREGVCDGEGVSNGLKFYLGTNLTDSTPSVG